MTATSAGIFNYPAPVAKAASSKGLQQAFATLGATRLIVRRATPSAQSPPQSLLLRVFLKAGHASRALRNAPFSWHQEKKH